MFFSSYKCSCILLQKICNEKINPLILSKQKKCVKEACQIVLLSHSVLFSQTRSKYITCQNYCLFDKPHWRTHGIDKPCLEQRWQVSLSNFFKFRFRKGKNAFHQQYELLYAAYFIICLVPHDTPQNPAFMNFNERAHRTKYRTPLVITLCWTSEGCSCDL